MKSGVYQKLLDFLCKLDDARITYSLDHFRAAAIMVTVAIPGERWEIEFLADGTVDIERFRSAGEFADEGALTELFAAYAE